MMYSIIPILFILYIYLGFKKPAIALITCPFVVGTVFIFGAAEEDNTVMASAGIILLSTVLAILFSKSDSDKSDWPKVVTRLIFNFTLIFLFLIFLFVLSPVLGSLGLLFSVLIVGSTVSYYITSRFSTISYVISTIGSCIRQNLPLPMALETAASGEKTARSKTLLDIKYWLVQGYSLAESIKRGFRSCPGYAIAMITAAEKINQLPLAMQAIENNMTSQAREKRKVKPIHPMYPLIVLAFMFCVMSGVFLFVMPQFATTLLELTEDAQLPAITRFVFNIVRRPSFTLGYIVLLSLLMTSPLIFFISIYVKFRPRNPDDPYFMSIIGDKIKWYLPIFHWFEKNYSMVQTIEMLRLSLNAGCTVNDAISNTIALDINFCFKKRLSNWLYKVESGQNISESARKSKLGQALAWAFDENVNQGNTIHILETLESFYRTNYSYCINLARFIMWPCIIIALGSIVCIVVLSIFLPSIEIINNLTRLM